MPVYNDVETIDYYPHPEQTARSVTGPTACYESVLDVGTGHGGVFDLDRWEQSPHVKRKAGCDMFWIRELPPGWETKLGVDACDLVSHYGENSFDFVQCCEVLEHIPDNKTALEQLVKVARKAVFITSADEVHHIGPEQDEIEKFNKYQAYVGQPKIEDLKRLGFQIRVDSDSKRQIIAWLIKE